MFQSEVTSNRESLDKAPLSLEQKKPVFVKNPEILGD